MTANSVTITVNMPCEHIFPVVSNISNWSNWVPVLISAPVHLNNATGTGARYSFPSRSRGQQPESQLEITDIIPDRKLKWRYSGGMDGWGSMSLTPESDGTRIVLEEEVALPGLPAQLLQELLEKGASNMKRYLENLSES